jgi:hypothetical protein
MSAHTPGPWSIRYEFNVFGNDRIVAGAGGYSSNVESEAVDSENRANTRLICAAPDMLAALKAVELHGYFGVEHLVLAAIAKAEGKQ